MRLALEGGIGGPAVGKLFPSLFARTSPAVERKAPLIMAASLLRLRTVEAAMLLLDAIRPVLPMRMGSKVGFVGGYSVLATLRRAKPGNGYRVLFEPSDNCAVGMSPVKSDQTLRDLLQAFDAGRFGFTTVMEEGMHAMVGLTDVLGLYESGELGSDLSVGDVASPPVAVGGDAPVKEVLKVMFDRRIRRVFVRGTKTFVSDREIVSNVFSPRRLEETKRDPDTLLQGTVMETGPVEAVEVEGTMSLKKAAQAVTQSQGGALLCRRGVVSPWDMVMKPFASGHLNIR